MRKAARLKQATKQNEFVNVSTISSCLSVFISVVCSAMYSYSLIRVVLRIYELADKKKQKFHFCLLEKAYGAACSRLHLMNNLNRSTKASAPVVIGICHLGSARLHIL